MTSVFLPIRKECSHTAHYFTDNRNLKENRKEHSFRFLGNLFTFVTDNGVFSKTGVDYGTMVLLETCTKEPLSGKILDLGCGYGPVGTVIQKLYPQADVTSVDVNPRAVELTEINAEKNQVKIHAYVSDGFEKIADIFNTIITNPPIRAGKKVIYKMFEDSYDHLVDHGKMYVVIRRQQGAESAVKKIESIFHNCEILTRDKGYWVLKAEKLTD